MNIEWSNSIQIDRPVAEVYAYLADFTRHPEWSLTLATVTLERAGDPRGVGAVYHASERQAMHTERAPGEPLTRGVAGTTVCEVTEAAPNRTLAWRAHFKPNMGVHSTWRFTLDETQSGGTTVRQEGVIHMPAVMTGVFQMMFGRDFPSKVRSQSDAGLRNIQAVLERNAVRQTA